MGRHLLRLLKTDVECRQYPLHDCREANQGYKDLDQVSQPPLAHNRRLVYVMLGQGNGHIQSVIFSAMCVTVGFLLFMLGFLADLMATNRRLLERIEWRLRRADLNKSGLNNSELNFSLARRSFRCAAFRLATQPRKCLRFFRCSSLLSAS